MTMSQCCRGLNAKVADFLGCVVFIRYLRETLSKHHALLGKSRVELLQEEIGCAPQEISLKAAILSERAGASEVCIAVL